MFSFLSSLYKLRRFLPFFSSLLLGFFFLFLNHYFLKKQRYQVSSEHLQILTEFAEDPSTGDLELIHASPLLNSFSKTIRVLDNTISDIMLRISVDQKSNLDFQRSFGDIVIVVIDDSSLDRYGQWPWSRNLLSRLVSSLHSSSAKVIGFDMVFAESDRTSPKNYANYFLDSSSADSLDVNLLDNDLLFAKTISTSRTILGCYFAQGSPPLDENLPWSNNYTLEISLPDGGGYIHPSSLNLRYASRAITNLPLLSEYDTGACGEGFFNTFPDDSGIVRSVPLFMHLQQPNPALEDFIPRLVYPSLSLEMLRVGLGANKYIINLSGEKSFVQDLPTHGSTSSDSFERYNLTSVSLVRSDSGSDELLAVIPVNELGELSVNYQGGTFTFPYLSAWQVLEGDFSEILKDKYVLIGASAGGLLDLRANMFDITFPGVEVHANVIYNALSSRYLLNSRSLNYYWQEIGIIFYSFLISFSMLFFNSLFGIFFSLLLCLSSLFLNYYFFFRHGIVIGNTMILFSSFVVFLSNWLFDFFILGSDKRFIRKAFSLNVSPSILSYLENNPSRLSSLDGEQRTMTVLFSDIRNFTSISEHLPAKQLAYFLNEYLTPMSDLILEHSGTVDKFIGDAIMAFWNAPADDADHAIHAARASLAMRDKLFILQQSWSSQGFPLFNIGCGINTGLMFAGYIGSQQRKNYTVMGDAVNTASRLEGMSKYYGLQLLITESTMLSLRGLFSCRFIDRVQLAGKQDFVDIYELLTEGSLSPSESLEVSRFSEFLHLYRLRNFSSSLLLLNELLEVNPCRLYKLYLDRVNYYISHPPNSDWDYVFKAVSK